MLLWNAFLEVNKDGQFLAIQKELGSLQQSLSSKEVTEKKHASKIV